MAKDRKKFLAKNFRALGDANRLKILCVILDSKRICVSDIAERLHMSVAIVSHHLKVLEKTGLLTPEKEGKEVCYLILKNKFVSDLKKIVCKYE